MQILIWETFWIKLRCKDTICQHTLGATQNILAKKFTRTGWLRSIFAKLKEGKNDRKCKIQANFFTDYKRFQTRRWIFASYGHR